MRRITKTSSNGLPSCILTGPAASCAIAVCGFVAREWMSGSGIANRNSAQLIVPNKGDYLECEEMRHVHRYPVRLVP